jgi:hypothetical protein
MTHVQLTGNIGRRHDDGEGLGIGLTLGLKVAAAFPHLVNAIFDLLGFVDLGQFSCHKKYSFVEIIT